MKSQPLAVLVLLVLLITDQAAKSAARFAAHVYSWGPVSIDYAVNPHALFSLPLPWSYSLAMSGVLVALVAISFFTPWRLQLALWCIVAGGVSNLLDRYRHGGVIDVFHIGELSLNIADLLIVGGAIAGLYFLMYETRGSGR